MMKSIVLTLTLAACSVARGAFVTDFSNSYALYVACANNAADFNSDQVINGVDFLSWQRGVSTTGLFINSRGDANRDSIVNQTDLGLWESQFNGPAGIPDAVCFKLYFDPVGITDGIVTAVIDAPNPGPGQVRFGDLSLVDVHPLYAAQILQSEILTSIERQRLEVKVRFAALNPLNPPAGPITLFGMQAEDALPQAGLNALASFDFRPGDFVTIFDTTTNQSTTFNFNELQKVDTPVIVPLTLDVDVLTGEIQLRNNSSSPLGFTHYEVDSLAGSLRPNGWLSLEEQDPPNSNWAEDGAATPLLLSETLTAGTFALLPGGSRTLGQAFNALNGAQDLRFMFRTLSGADVPGMVNYHTGGPTVPVPEPTAAWLTVSAVLAGTAGRCLFDRKLRILA